MREGEGVEEEGVEERYFLFVAFFDDSLCPSPWLLLIAQGAVSEGIPLNAWYYCLVIWLL